METAAHIFLDIETTGLDARWDVITEVAWIRNDGIERQFFVAHVRQPNPWVLEKTDYLSRILPARKTPFAEVAASLRADCAADGSTHLVGACPAFDDRFLRAALGAEPPYHYHLIDVESVAMGAFGWPLPQPLKDLREACGLPGANPAPHTALGDAREVKAIWDALAARPVAR